MTPDADLVGRLVEHSTLGGTPRKELEWLASHGILRRFNEGDVVMEEGVPVDGLHLHLTGHIAIFTDSGVERHKVMEWRGGDVGGLTPYSRMIVSPGRSFALAPSEMLVIPRALLPEMIRECHEVTTLCVHRMIDRARVFKSDDLRDERMISLGKLAAGLAHELNNPAAAIGRSAMLLDSRMGDAEQAALALGATGLTDAQVRAIDALRESCLASHLRGVLSPLQQSDREDAIADWLRAHHVDPVVAEPLAETSVTLDALDLIAESVSGPTLEPVLRWVASGSSARALASEIQDAAARISGIVVAMKGFTGMDQARVTQPLDVAINLGNTITLLRSKAQARAISISLEIPPDLPPALGFVGELNQVWMNLIDNAIDAAPDGGHVTVTAHQEANRLVVRVIDNGAGIPEGIRDRIFEPFVTSKPVGKGTGLGLHIVRGLLQQNDAEIALDSRPGRTEFRLSLRIANRGTTGVSA